MCRCGGGAGVVVGQVWGTGSGECVGAHKQFMYRTCTRTQKWGQRWKYKQEWERQNGDTI